MYEWMVAINLFEKNQKNREIDTTPPLLTYHRRPRGNTALSSTHMLNLERVKEAVSGAVADN